MRTHPRVYVWFLVAGASVGLACGSYVQHVDSGPPPLPTGTTGTTGTMMNNAMGARAGAAASSTPSTTIMTAMAGTQAAAANGAGMSAADGLDAGVDIGAGGSRVTAAISGSGAGGSAGRASAGAGGASGSSGRAGASGRGGASGSDDGDDQTPTRDVTGPCRALDLFCVNNLDMFLLNPECFTCNDGMGCQACEFFRAI